MNILRQIITGSVALSLAGCISTPTKTPAELRASNASQIIGMQDFNAVGVAIDGATRSGTNISVAIEFIDGRSYFDPWRGGYAWSVEVSPGEHTVHVVCNGYVNGVSASGDSVVLVQAEAGRIYQLKQDHKLAACAPEVVDVTAKY